MNLKTVLLAALALTFSSAAFGQVCPLPGGCAPQRPAPHQPDSRPSQQQQRGSDDEGDRGPSRYELADRKTDTAYIYLDRFKNTGDYDDFLAARDAFVEARRLDSDYSQACIGMVELLDKAEANGTSPPSNHESMISWADAALKTKIGRLQNSGRIKEYLKLIIDKEKLAMAMVEIDTLHTTTSASGVVDPRVDVTKAYKDAQKKVAELQKKYDKARAQYERKL